MKLYFMKQAALDNLKANLSTAYQNYFTEDNSDWIKEFCNDAAPFEEFKTVQDFELSAEVEGSRADFENCKIIYPNLKFLTEVQAADERFWAGLTHSNFYNYVRARYNYSPLETKKDSVASVERNFFFSGGTKVGNITNALAKCWWMGRLLYDEKSANPFEKLDRLGSAQFSSKIWEILKRSFSANQNILNGIVEFFAQCPNLTREEWKKVLQHLNKIGGNIILDCLNEGEIAKILIDYAEKNFAVKKSADTKKIIPVPKNISAAPKIIDTSKKVEFGDEIKVVSLFDRKINTFTASHYKIYSAAKDKKIGEKFFYNGRYYKITEITRGNVNGGNKL